MAARSSDAPRPGELRTLLRTARSAAAHGAAYVLSRRRAGGLHAERKGQGDFVTAVDIGTENRLRHWLQTAHPDHAVLGEERGRSGPTDARLVWVIDPIDGTSNFANGLHPYAVSVACLCNGQPVAAAVHCEPESVVYSAAVGLGAFRRGRRLAPLRPRLDDAAILGVQWFRGARELPFLPGLLATGARIRNYGCTVTQLCDTAAGRLDGNVQQQGKVWDIAAAGLVAVEAGLRFTSWSGEDLFPFAELDPSVDHASVTAAPQTHGRLLRSLVEWSG